VPRHSRIRRSDRGLFGNGRRTPHARPMRYKPKQASCGPRHQHLSLRGNSKTFTGRWGECFARWPDIKRFPKLKRSRNQRYLAALVLQPTTSVMQRAIPLKCIVLLRRNNTVRSRAEQHGIISRRPPSVLQPYGAPDLGRPQSSARTTSSPLQYLYYYIEVREAEAWAERAGPPADLLYCRYLSKIHNFT